MKAKICRYLITLQLAIPPKHIDAYGNELRRCIAHELISSFPIYIPQISSSFFRSSAVHILFLKIKFTPKCNS